MSDLQFRAASHDDVEPVVALVESAYRGEASRRGWTTEADLLDGQRTDTEAVADLVDTPQSIILLAESGGRPVGCVSLRQAPDTDHTYFGMFAVEPGMQGGGVGRAIVVEAARRSLLAGRPRMEMSVIRQRQELIAWYERLGFVHTGRTEPFPYGEERFGRPRRDDLEFVILEGDCRALLLAAAR
jgi:ribosomal protein S18 acetylase RimI-like enzyme